MNKILPLMQREWLQHRGSWALMLAIPLALAALALSFGQVQIDADEREEIGTALPALLAMAAIAGTAAVMFIIAALSSLVLISGLARRDHGDRSVEFWLSMPVGHSASMATPMLVHLLLVPAAALLVGLAAGYGLSALLVGRMVGLGEWFALPWASLVPATLAIALRLLAGLPLALLWLSPLVLLVVLMTAWFRRWGVVILAVGLSVGSIVLKQVFGQAWLGDIVKALLQEAATALVSGQGGMHVSGGAKAYEALSLVPTWALHDLGAALADLANPLLPGALLFAAGCFYLLVQWRQRGASAAA
jgi:ABC-2 type transport system permease protein